MPAADVSAAGPAVPGATAPAVPPRRLRLVYCLSTLEVGGTELNAVRTAERLDPARYDLRVVVLRDVGPLGARFAALGVPVHEFRPGGLASPGMVREVRRFARYLVREGVDVVHSHDRYANLLAAPAAHLARRVAGRGARGPRLVTSKRWLWWPRHFQLANMVAYRLSDRVLANSPFVADTLRRRDRVPAGRVVVVPNFVDDAAFAPLAEGERAARLAAFGVPAGALVVGVVARLHPVKDHASLVRAAALLAPRRPALHVLLVGDGPTRGPLEQLARSLGVADRVHFAGYQPQQPSPHGLLDVSVLCSSFEGFPNAVVEAMAAGRPVVATAVGGVPDAVVDGATGLLVPPGDPTRLADALDRLLADPARRAVMGQAGRTRAREQYLASSVLPRLTRLYDGLVEPDGDLHDRPDSR